VPDGVPWSRETADRLTARTFLALLVAGFAFYLYRSTLLPGVDFGDTASFQALIGERAISPRDAYPLYFAIGNLVSRLAGGEAAYGVNLASAICGALACGVLTWAAVELTGSLIAGAAGGLLLAASYTFWTQCIIAEVYALHLLMMGLVLTALLWWDRHRTRRRLAIVFALYALSFGNHLMTVLMAPAIILFVASAPGGARLLFSPRTILMALAIAAAGACQYLWNASYLWALPDPPQTLSAFARAFWFDVTKSDWRETMVLAVHHSVLMRRSSMYLFDLTQQFGAMGIALAVIGVLSSLRRPRTLLLLLIAWTVPFVFAYTYNVGDTHVFFLPSHQIVALAAACGVAALLSLTARLRFSGTRHVAVIVAGLLLAYPLWRAWDTWPAVDRHADRRPVDWLSAVAVNLGSGDLLLGDVNWQLENGFDYYQRHLHPELNLTRATDTVLTLPFLVRANLADGRAVYATPIARDIASAAYGSLFAFEPDSATDTRPLAARLSGLAPGTPYVLAVLSPYSDLTFDQHELADATRFLTGGTAILGREASYTVIAGRVGERPALDRREDLPWRAGLMIDGLAIDIRMESWLASDTIRRAGFGQVVANRKHALILERGVSLVALSPAGDPQLMTYASSLFAPLTRYRVVLR
jgi:hypothetical protein